VWGGIWISGAVSPATTRYSALDMRLPGINGFETFQRIHDIDPKLPVIIMTAYPDRTLADWFSNPEDAIIARNWDDVMRIIGPDHGSGTRVAVLPNATMQYFAQS